MLKRYLGDNDEGVPEFEYTLTPEEVAEGHAAFVTGSEAKGNIALGEPYVGVRYNVTDAVIPVKLEHVAHLHIAIHEYHHANGRFLDIPVPSLDDVTPKPVVS